MRISIVNLNLVAKDAIGNIIIEQARYFVSRGDNVTIFVQEPPEGVSADVASLCRVVNLGELRQDADGAFAATDLYIYHYPNRYSLIETIAEVDGGFVIFYYHNVTPPELWNREEDRHILRSGVEGVTLATYADLIVSDSAYNLTDISQKIRVAPERLLELPAPVDTSAFHPGEAPESLRQAYRLGEAPVLLYVGRMAHNKRIDLLVQTLAAVRRHRDCPAPAPKLLLVGDNASAPAYRQEAQGALKLARELGVADAVIFAGRVDQLPDHYRLASVYVSTSQHEGFCVPLIEAMASGVPIVAAGSTAIPGTLGDAGSIVAANAAGEASAEDMAEAVVQVLTNPQLAGQLRDKGLLRAKDFATEKYRERLAAMVDQYVTNLPLRVAPRDPGSPAAGTRNRNRPSKKETVYWPELMTEAKVAMPEYVVRSRVPVVGSLIAWTRRNMTSHVKEPYLDLIVFRQQGFNLRSAWVANELARRLTELGEKIEAQLERFQGRQFRLESQLTRIESQLAATQAAGATAAAAAPPGELEALPQRAYGLNYMSCNEAVGGALQVEMALYAEFAPLFRGRSGPVLDLGCGRGAFLSLMRQEGIPSEGVDIDPGMVDYCRAAGLEAMVGDVFEALQCRPAESLGGIFSAHVVEHLPRTRLMELAALCWEKLEPGAAVVWITPNGAGLSALHAAFYKDLTHTRPLHPDTLAFILESSGFLGVKATTLSDMPAETKLRKLPESGDEATAVLNENIRRLNELLFGHLDCAVMGRRP